MQLDVRLLLGLTVTCERSIVKFSLWSNLYPSAQAPYYGTFVQSAFNAWEQVLGVERVRRCVIDRPSTSRILKLRNYTALYLRCVADAMLRRPNLVEIHYPFFFIPLLFLLPKNGIVLRFHGSDLEKLLSSSPMRWLFQLAAPRLLCVVVPSRYYQRRISEELGFSGKVIVIAPDAVSDLFYPCDNAVVSEATFVLGVVGRLEKDKNFQEVIEALALLNDERVRLLVVGGGPYRQALIDLTRERGIYRKVDWIGPVARDALVHHLHKMNVFVFSSARTAESFGLVGLEALACGIPVIARCSLQGAREYLDDSNACFYENSSATLAQALRQYLALSMERRAAMSRSALKAATRFNYNDTVLDGVKRLVGLHAKTQP